MAQPWQRTRYDALAMLKCPRCGSDNIETTTMGFIGMTPDRDPNRATCHQCAHQGNAGDWWVIDELRADQKSRTGS